jgi:hypothetical protein
METRQRSWFFLLGAALFVALAALAVYRSWPLLFPSVTVAVSPDPGCDLSRAPCGTRLEDGASVRFSIMPRSIPVMKPLELEVVIDGMEVERVQVDFVGVDMDMGFNRVRLQSADDGRFIANAVLPVCVRRRMEWEARVLAQTDRGLISVPFRFFTVSPSGQ